MLYLGVHENCHFNCFLTVSGDKESFLTGTLKRFIVLLLEFILNEFNIKYIIFLFIYLLLSFLLISEFIYEVMIYRI